jgi:hypothetical protein
MLIVATRERDAASAQIESLRRELSMYLSVPAAAAAEGKKKIPRATTMTRVGRMPLLPVTQSERVNCNNDDDDDDDDDGLRVGTTRGSGDFDEHLPPLGEGEMTLDEIM